jgi:hypothetical protein
MAFVLVMLSFHNYNNWKTIQKNWNKENVRDALNLWLKQTGATKEIYFYSAATPVFRFYAESIGLDYGKEVLDNYGTWGDRGRIDASKFQYKNFHYGENLRGRDVDYIKSSLQKSFSNNMPDNFWFMLSHASDNKLYMDALSEMAYGYRVYRWPDARLLWLFNFEYIDKNYNSITDKNTSMRAFITNIDQLTEITNTDDVITLKVEGKDPKIFLTLLKDTRYDIMKDHYVFIDFSSNYAGNLQLFFKYNINDEFTKGNSVVSQYVAGNKKLMIELPRGTNLDTLRLDIDDTNVPDTEEDIIRILDFSILESIRY